MIIGWLMIRHTAHLCWYLDRSLKWNLIIQAIFNCPTSIALTFNPSGFVEEAKRVLLCVAGNLHQNPPF